MRPLANQFPVNDHTIMQVHDLLAEASDLAAQLETCTSSLAAADEWLQQRRRKAMRRQKDAERVAAFEEAVGSGTMTVEATVQKRQTTGPAQAESGKYKGKSGENSPHITPAAEGDQRRGYCGWTSHFSWRAPACGGEG